MPGQEIWQVISDAPVFGDMLTLGIVGFVAGFCIPMAFRIVGWLIESVRLVLQSDNSHLERS